MHKEDKQWLNLLDAHLKEINGVLQSNLVHIKQYLTDLKEGKNIKLSLLNSEVIFLDVNDPYVTTKGEREKIGRIIEVFPKTEEPDPEIVEILKAAKQFKIEKHELTLKLNILRRTISRKLEKIRKKRRVYRINSKFSPSGFEEKDPAEDNNKTYEYYINQMLSINTKMLTKVFILRRLYLTKLK